ncbi:MAG: TolC family protein [Pirellulales bacterium]
MMRVTTSHGWRRWLAGMLLLTGCRSEGRFDSLSRDLGPSPSTAAALQWRSRETASGPTPVQTAAKATGAVSEVRQVAFSDEDAAPAAAAADRLVPPQPPAPIVGAEGAEEVPARGTPESLLPPQLDQEEQPIPRSSAGPLQLRTVTESVYESFPALEAALREFEIAGGKQVSAWGEFDLKLKAESMSQPEGYYENYRNVVKLEQALMPGGNVYGAYRIGDGNFPVYYGERETNEGGEFKLGWETPLLRNRSIDDRRAELFQTTLRRQQVDPAVQSLLLDFTFGAADAYWSWVAAGLSYEAQRELLRVTIDRNEQFVERVKREDLAEIELVQNERLIASREAKVIEARRKLQQATIKLSLYLRDEMGRQVLPSPSLLPAKFPEPTPPQEGMFTAEVDRALTQRPELVELDLQRQLAEVDLAVGENLRLPELNAIVLASKDVGASATKKNERGPFELEAGLYFEVPLQRRKADGKIQSAYGKIAQIAAKREFTENKITIEVQDAQSALVTSYERVARARRSVELARQLEDAERKRFDAQDSDLLRVAIQEAAEIEATLLEIETLADYFKALAALRAAIGVDPLAQDGLPAVERGEDAGDDE